MIKKNNKGKFIKGSHPNTEFKKGSSGFTGKHTKETKRKIGLIWKGKKFSEQHKANIKLGLLRNIDKLRENANKPERIKISIANLPKDTRGARSGSWKGGINPINDTIRKSIQSRLWRESVFARDNWTCQKYGIRSGKIHAHHIQNFAQYPELRFAIDNGITLSDMAHREFHRHFGTKNNTKEQIEKYIKYITL